ncbi:MAG: hypothetical protein K0S09_3254 [Sphingobacteriaceae bacterium]|jgi:hypothetical protein|nr:hypothetical protein [Sphingobacteriaceae bacterium]
MGRLFTIVFSAILLMAVDAFSQTDSAVVEQPRPVRQYRYRDSATLARFYFRRDSIKAAKDSIAARQDSIKKVYVTPLPAGSRNRFLDSLIETYTVKDLDFAGWSKKFQKQKATHFNMGNLRAKGERWTFFLIVALILAFAIVNRAFSKEISTIMLAFYSNKIREDSLFNSWPFLILYVIFAFTVGMFLYLCAKHYELTFNYTGIQAFLALSIAILILFTAKIIVLKALGFLFDIQPMVKEYISILYLAYFNAALLFLPIVVAFSLTPARLTNIYIYLSVMVLAVIFAVQLYRIVINILTQFKFSKTYLFIYLCALEVCPLLLVIKAVR